jgi:hypothetical protein
MNWDAIGAIAELLGAAGVIASLVYLATQIRHSQEQMAQNTQALRASAYQEVVNQRDSAMLPLMQDGELAELCARGTENLGDLSDDEKRRFGVWIFTAMSSSDNIYYQYRLGFVEEERWQTQLARLKALLSGPGVRVWWATSGSSALLSTRFIALVEEILGEEAGDEG